MKPGDDPLQPDPHMRAALQHAPDAGLEPPADLDRCILAEARQAASPPAAATSARPTGRRTSWVTWLDALRTPGPAAALATLVLGTVIVALWSGGPPPLPGEDAAEAPAAPVSARSPAAPGAPPARDAATTAAAEAPGVAAERRSAAPTPPDTRLAPREAPKATPAPALAPALAPAPADPPAPAPAPPPPPPPIAEATNPPRSAEPSPPALAEQAAAPLPSTAARRMRAEPAAAPAWQPVAREVAPAGGRAWTHPVSGESGRLVVVTPTPPAEGPDAAGTAAASRRDALDPMARSPTQVPGRRDTAVQVWWIPATGPAWRLRVPDPDASPWRDGTAQGPWPPAASPPSSAPR